MDQYKYHQITKQADRLSRYAVPAVRRTPEYQQLNNAAAVARRAVDKRFDVLQRLKRHAAQLRWGEDDLPKYDESDVVLLNAACKALGKFIGAAEARLKVAQAEYDRIREEMCRLEREHGRDKPLGQVQFFDRERTNENQ